MTSSPLAGVPTAPVRVPAIVAELARGGLIVPVWENQLGGVTFRVDAAPGAGAGRSAAAGREPERSAENPERVFVKWAPSGAGWDPAPEADRLAWAERFTPVPRVVAFGADDEDAWLVTAAVPGENAVRARWIADPPTAVRALGAGLRALHDALPVEGCPFSWSVEDRLRSSTSPQAAGFDLPVPPADRLVVCHGDACPPNTLVGSDGMWSAHVDLGSLGVADRWADLAVATWSTEWNYGPGFEPVLLEAYGVEPDPARTEFYRALWDAT